jgi:diguanylate cyclase (GGDEF)-like protein/PAS domain S-box-containing protein
LAAVPIAIALEWLDQPDQPAGHRRQILLPVLQRHMMLDERTRDLVNQPELRSKLMQFAMDNASIEIYWLCSDARICYANDHARKTLGYTEDEILQLSLPDLDPNYPMGRWGEHWRELKRDKTQSFETLHKRKDGAVYPVEVVANYVCFDGHEYNVGFAKDITKRKRAEDALHEKEEFFRMITENANDFIAVLDLEGRRLYNNPSYIKLFGGAEALKGTDSFNDIHPDDRERIRQLFRKTVQSGMGHRAEFRFLLEDGSIRYMESSGGLIRNSRGDPLRVMVVSHDITERKRAENRIRDLAFHDSLTKLPNRRLLGDRLAQIMAVSKRSGLYSALMFLDLDNFKPLNDEHGHGAGDMLLIEAASRIKSCVREMDTVARFGGDEFMVMLNELDADKTQSAAKAATVAEKIRTALARPYLIHIHHDGNAEAAIEHSCTSSIGVVMFINHESSAEELIRGADKAMYQAKEAGRNQIHFYDPKS